MTSEPATEPTLEAPTAEDLPFIRRLWSDEATMRAVGGPIMLSDHEAQEWLRVVGRGRPRHWYYMIVIADHAPIGEVGAHRMDPSTGKADFNIKILHTERGRGYGLSAALLFCDLFFGSIGGQELVDPIAVGNQPGRNLLERVGFEFHGESDGTWVMRLSKDRYAQTRGRRQD